MSSGQTCGRPVGVSFVPPELKDEVRKQLKESYMALEYSQHGTEHKAMWVCDDIVLKMDSTVVTKIPYGFRTRYCNKSTAIYCSPSAQSRKSLPPFIFGCIFKKWFRFHNERPMIENCSFVTVPVRITETGPTKIVDILSAHRSLCESLASHAEKCRGEAACRADRNYAETPPWKCRIPPLFRAVVMVLDALKEPSSTGIGSILKLDKELLRQTVLLVHTGEDSGLSAPISFRSLDSDALPLKRDDVTTNDGIKIVRVSLGAGVCFVADLERREEDAHAYARDRWEAEMAQKAEEWAEKKLQRAEKDGIVETPWMVYAVRRALAAQRGEELEEYLIDYPFRPRWV